MNDKETESVRGKLIQELRRGILALATLTRLEEPMYGYSLITELSKLGLEIDQGTLYPLLRRLEEQGLLLSEWNVEGTRPRRYYKISPKGKDLLPELLRDWRDLVGVMDAIIQS